MSIPLGLFGNLRTFSSFDNLGTFSSIEAGDLRWANKIKRMQNPVFFEIIGKIEEIETIAIGGRIHDIMRIQKRFKHLYSRLT